MFGERLRTLRNDRGYTQKELAQKLDISSSTIAMYETGKRQPDQTTLKRLADFFHVSVDYLLGRTEDKNFSYNLREYKQRDVIDVLDYLKEQLKSVDNLTFNNEKINEEEIQDIIEAVKIGIIIAKKRSKQ